MYHDKSSLEHILQVCKQQQTTLGNKNFLNGNKLLVVFLLTMKLGSFIETEITGLKQKQIASRNKNLPLICLWLILEQWNFVH